MPEIGLEDKEDQDCLGFPTNLRDPEYNREVAYCIQLNAYSFLLFGVTMGVRSEE